MRADPIRDTGKGIAAIERASTSTLARTLSPESVLLGAAALLWSIPAALSLAENVWVTEAGSIAPFILILGGWVLWQTWQANRSEWRGGGSPLAWIALVFIALVYLFAAMIAMPSLLALATWAGGLVAFYLRFGWPMTRVCLLPWLFLLLVVPLPYALSLDLNVVIRQELAQNAVAFASRLGIDAALERHFIIVGPYVLGVENACAGTNSTVTLVALALLYAFWTGGGGWRRVLAFAALAVPVAMSANTLRIVLLMLSVDAAGAAILETQWHPIAGLVSFCIAFLLLLALDAAWRAVRPIGRRAGQRAGQGTSV